MLADRTAGVEDRLKILEDEAESYRAEIDRLKVALREAESRATAPEKVEVPVIPAALSDNLATLATRAEALADEVEAKAKSG
jgi:cell division protein ZapA